MQRDGTLLFTPRQVFVNLAASCGGGVAVIAFLARDRTAAISAAAAFGFATLVSALLATVGSEGAGRLRGFLRIAAVTSLGASSALPGWYFGPNSAYAGVLAIVLLFAGLLMGGEHTPFPARGGWFVYLGLAGGQAIVATLVLTHTIEDVGLLPMLPPGSEPWHHVAAHVVVQLVYATAFGIGRAFHQRYWKLSEELEVATRAAARRSALLDEARAEYRRTFALGREGIFAGQTIGRYQLGELIGRGGAGEVYDARDVVDGSRAAVKMLRGDRLGDAANVRGFLDEATALTRVDSPHVVRTRHVGSLDEILPYIAMERLDGKNLAELIARSGRLDRAAIRRLVDDGGNALDAVHRAGITHGDVQPSNLLLETSGWKLIDFGSRNSPDPDRVVGTPRYVPPEVLGGGRAGPATDLYGLCACIYMAITGQAPYAEVTQAALPQTIARELPLDPRLRGEIDDMFAAVLALGLSPTATERFPDAATLRATLLAALDGTLEPALRARADALPPWRVQTIAITGDATGTQAPRASQRTLDMPAPAVAAQAGGVATPGARVAFANSAVVAAAMNLARDGAPDATIDARALVAPADRAPPAPVPSHEPVLTASLTESLRSGSIEDVASTAWHGAAADKMRVQFAAVFSACVVGAVLIGLIVDEPAVRWFGWGTIGAAATVVAIERKRRLDWPWAIIAVVAIGPAYIFGLHSAFASVVAIILFVDGSFRPSASLATGRWVLIAVVGTNVIAFALISARVIPDGVVTPVLHHAPTWSGVVIQLCVTSVYVVAFTLGRTINARYVDLVRRNDEAARDAAAKEALLASARAEVERVLAGYTGGLFTGSRIGSYEIGRLLGRGGMGEVYVATKGGAQVALKVIRADRAGNTTDLRRFAREAEALVRVESPYVARVLEVGTEDGRLPFLAMELVEGTSLAEQLHGKDKLELAAARQMGRDVARGLADVHRAGVVHRDVKPHNLVLTTIEGAPRWKLVDFGIAKIDGGTATTGHVIVGTPAYMAPEQLIGGKTDARADLYSLSLVLFRVLAGRPAFTQSRVTSADQRPPDPTRIPDLPPDVGLVLRIGLATAPADRFVSATDFEAALDAAFDGRLGDAIRGRARALLVQEPWD